MVTPTYDGSGQTVHPCVIDFKTEYQKDTWAGYRYWMVMTPYPYKERMMENPSLLASTDGMNWFVPHCITNPIVKNKPPDNNADTDMIYDDETNELCIYYVNDNRKTRTSRIFRVKVSENMSVSTPEVVYCSSKTNYDSSMISPCIWKESKEKWHMWGVMMGYPNHFMHKFRKDGINWSNATICLNENGKNPFASMGLRAWHPSCKPNYTEKRIEFLVASRTDTSRNSPQSIVNRIIYAQCPMDNLTQISLPLKSPVIAKSDTGWDGKVVYRTTFVIENMHFAYRYRVWYSACSAKDRWGIGFTDGYLGTDNTNNFIAEQKKMISKLYQNAAQDNCLIKIKIRKMQDTAELALYDQSGTQIEKQKLRKGRNKVYLDLRNLTSDKYVYVINVDDRFVEGGKIQKPIQKPALANK